MSQPAQIEKESLEAHVEICAVRYANLETKLENFEQRMDKLEGYLVGIRDSLEKKLDGQTKASTGYIVTIFGVILSALLGYISHGIFK